MKKLIIIMLFLVTTINCFGELKKSINGRLGSPSYEGSDTDYDKALSASFAVALGIENTITNIFSVAGDFGLVLQDISYDTYWGDYSEYWSRLDLRSFLKLRKALGSVTPFVKVGPTASYIIKVYDDDFDELDIDNNLLFGFAAEIGTAFEISGSNPIEIGLFYQRDVTEFLDDINVYVQNIGLSLSVEF